MGTPSPVVNFFGHCYLRTGITKLGAAVNLAVYDPTHEQEAAKWVSEQLRKKRRVFRDVSEKMDFVMFSTDIPDTNKAIYAIRQKFERISDTIPKLVEITDPEQLGVHVEEKAKPEPKPEPPKESKE